ncbi:MAG: glycosyltransferase family 4 protein, partial [Candidatus Omnitrophica bacterium]|nr:glycosyltransferase family 4 protein [Candidatus Omnitrophota bacterium]
EEKNYIIDLGITSHQEKVNLLHISDVLVLPSEYEAFGIVFLEAWSCGIPVIGTDKGAIPNVINSSGLTFKCGDKQDLAEKIEFLLNNPSLSKIMATNGKNKVINFYNSDRIGELVLNAYKEVLT